MHTANGRPREIVTTTACSVVIRLRLTKFDASFLLPLLGPLMLCSFPYLGAINRTTDRSTLIFSSRRPILSILIFFQI